MLHTYSELGGSIDISALACPSSFTATVTPPVFALFHPGLPDPLLTPSPAIAEAMTLTFYALALFLVLFLVDFLVGRVV